MPTHILSLDQGTTSSRAIVFDHAGQVVAVAQRELEQHFPKPGWVEHDPEEIWLSQVGVAEEALRGARMGAGDLACLGITNQRETTVLWDRATGRALHNAIVWQDRRTAEAVERLVADGHDAMIRRKTGLVPDAYFSASKLAWLLDNVDGARRRAEAGELAFGTIDSWLLYKLTDGAVHSTDASNASRTMLYDIENGRWDEDLLDLFGIPGSVLPTVRSSSFAFGETAVDSVIRGVPIAGIAGDQQAALAGQHCNEPGMAKNTYGTGCFMLLNTGDTPVASQNNLLTTVAWSIDGKLTYALEGSVFIGGAVVQWLRDGLEIIRTAPDVERLALSEPDSGGVYFVPAFAGLGAPHWDPHARGVICGITRGTTAGHIARAAIESIAFQVADLVDAMQADTGLRVPELRVDGGAATNDLLLQLQADLLQTPVVRPTVTETTAFGAAILAGRAVGFWTPDEPAEEDAIDRRFEPEQSADDVAEQRGRWSEAVERAKHWDRAP